MRAGPHSAGHELSVPRIGKFTNVKIIGAGHAQKDLRAHRPLIAFNEIEVRGADSKVFGHTRLG